MRTALFAASALSMLWGYRLLLYDHAPTVFCGVAEDLSYGWYVPIFSAYVLWRERREVAESVGRPSAWGLLLALPFLFVGFLGAAGCQIRFEIVGFVGLLVSMSLAFFGPRTARQTLFPALFLLFCLPLHSFLDIVTIHLRMFAVSVAYAVLQGIGVETLRQGTMLMSASGSFSIDVADPCSGLRSLFAMMALSAGYGYFTQPTWPRRAALFALSVPIAIAGNVVRVLSVALVAATCSPDFATGFYHDYSGYVVFLVAVAFMVAAGGLISRGVPYRASAAPARLSGVPTGGRASLAVPVAMAVVVIGAMSYQAQTHEPVLCEPPNVRLADIPGYSSETFPPSEGELNVLPSDTIIDKRVYTAQDGAQFLVELVVGGHSKSSIHRPEMCLPSQGFQMTDPRNREVLGDRWRVLTLARRDAPSQHFAYTFFNQAGCRTSSHVVRIMRDVWDRSVNRRIDRWAMVTVNAFTADELRLLAFLADLGRDLR